MKKSNTTTQSSKHYDDENTPKEDMPSSNASNKTNYSVEPLPESSRPRQDGPGGENGK